MKKILLLVFTLLFTLTTFAQATNEGEPVSWSLSEEKTSILPIQLKSLDIKVIKAEDQKNDMLQGKPWRYGIQRNLDYGLNRGGKWTELDNGDRIWRIAFNSPEAINISVNFNSFYLPKGSTIYLYSNDRSDLVGAYTNQLNNKHKMLGTWFVKGDNIIIEYYEPKEVKGEGALNIGSLIHGYRLANEFQKNYLNSEEKALNDSGDCNYDVDCSIGSDYAAQKDILKKSVAFLSLGNGFICSGALVNNTAQDKKPYFLTANHCFTDPNGIDSNPALYTMRFNWISPNPVCGSATASTNGPTNFTMNGSTLRARNENSDFLLVEINNSIPSGWDVTYAGWDRTDNIPSFTVGIHHPSGDIMKVCRDNNPPIKLAQNAGGSSPVAQTWDITGLTTSTPTGGGLGWEIGVTEGGSSGSPLFDQNGRIVGQLYGGLAACSDTNDNNGHDYYGRFGISWNGRGSTSRLKDWLDTGNLEPNTLDTLQNVLATNDEVLEQNLTLYPNPTSGLIQVKIADISGDLKYDVFNLLGQNLRSNLLKRGESIDLSTLPNSIYLVKVTDLARNASLTKKIVLNR